jgi:hypothetical protein
MSANCLDFIMTFCEMPDTGACPAQHLPAVMNQQQNKSDNRLVVAG